MHRITVSSIALMVQPCVDSARTCRAGDLTFTLGSCNHYHEQQRADHDAGKRQLAPVAGEMLPPAMQPTNYA